MMQAVMASYKEVHKEMQKKAKQLKSISISTKYSVSPMAMQSESSDRCHNILPQTPA